MCLCVCACMRACVSASFVFVCPCTCVCACACVCVFTQKKGSENPGLSGQYQISVFTRPASGGSLAANCDTAVGAVSTAAPPSTLTRQSAVRRRVGHRAPLLALPFGSFLTTAAAQTYGPLEENKSLPLSSVEVNNAFCLQKHRASNNFGSTLPFLSQPPLCIHQPACLPLFVLVYLCRHRGRGGLWRKYRNKQEKPN